MEPTPRDSEFIRFERGDASGLRGMILGHGPGPDGLTDNATATSETMVEHATALVRYKICELAGDPEDISGIPEWAMFGRYLDVPAKKRIHDRIPIRMLLHGSVTGTPLIEPYANDGGVWSIRSEWLQAPFEVCVFSRHNTVPIRVSYSLLPGAGGEWHYAMHVSESAIKSAKAKYAVLKRNTQ